MHCLIVGADNLGTLPNTIQTVCPGAQITHWNGRSKKLPTFPCDVTVVIIFTGFIRHQIMEHARKESKKRNLRPLYLCRGKSEIMDLAKFLNSVKGGA